MGLPQEGPLLPDTAPNPSSQPSTTGLEAGLSAAAYHIKDSEGAERRTVIMTYATTQMFNHDKAQLFLWSLANVQLPDGSNMSSHTVVMCLSVEAAQRCSEIHLGQQCVLQPEAGTMLKPHQRRALLEEDEAIKHFTSSWYGLGVVKVMFLLNTLLLDTDVLFFDLDVIVFQVGPSGWGPGAVGLRGARWARGSEAQKRTEGLTHPPFPPLCRTPSPTSTAGRLWTLCSPPTTATPMTGSRSTPV